MGRDQDTMDVNVDYDADWQEIPDTAPYKNPYRFGWEGFIRHVVADEPFWSPLPAGIRDVQLAEACLASAAGHQWIDLPVLA